MSSESPRPAPAAAPPAATLERPAAELLAGAAGWNAELVLSPELLVVVFPREFRLLFCEEPSALVRPGPAGGRKQLMGPKIHQLRGLTLTRSTSDPDHRKYA